MPFDFPNSPTLNQTVTNGAVTYLWDGTKWIVAYNAISEAPRDGQVYGRQGSVAAWVPTLPLTGGTVAQLTVSGPVTVGTPGISYGWLGATGAGIAFTYSAGTLNPWIGGVAQGALASQSWVTSAINSATSGGPFLPLSGGTVIGGTTFSGSGTSLTVTNNATINGGAVINGGISGWGLNLTNAGLIVGGSTAAGAVRLIGPTGFNRDIQFYSPGGLGHRWDFGMGVTLETGNSAGSNLRMDAYDDNGGYAGALSIASRRSGPLGQGTPWYSYFGPWRQSTPLAARGGGVIGNDQEFISNGDVQPTVTLAANPLAVVSGSAVVTVMWAGSVSSSQIAAVSEGGWDTWVNIGGATATGGITVNGWYQVTSTVDGDHFTIHHSANATATVAAGGGSSVTIRPSVVTQVNKVVSTIRTAANGFPLQTTELLNIDPEVFVPLGSANYSRYEHRWSWTVGPNPGGTLYQWSLGCWEWDLTNRGVDVGYSPSLYGSYNGTVAFWVGPVDIPSWATGGGTATNWNTVYTVFQTNGQFGVYDAFSTQPNSLVGAARDPTGHGGVAFDAIGAEFNAGSFSTSVGTSTITVHTKVGTQVVQANGNQIWLGGPPQTLAGVTFGGAVYTMSNVNDAAGTFTITGTGTASSSTTGGAITWFAFSNLVPYAPFQLSGSFKHGLISSTTSRVESGLIVETQPGNGVGWNDGTGIASVNSSSISAGNLNVDLWPVGTGSVQAHGNLGVSGTVTNPNPGQTALTAAVAGGGGGTGYAVNDTFAFVGNGRGTVATVSGGVVTGITNNTLPTTSGTPPANPVPTTTLTGSGSGLVLSLQWSGANAVVAPGPLNIGVQPLTAISDGTISGAGVPLWQIKPVADQFGFNAGTMQLNAWQGLGITSNVNVPTAATIPPGLNSIWMHPRAGSFWMMGFFNVLNGMNGVYHSISNLQIGRTGLDLRIQMTGAANNLVPTLTSTTPVTGGTNVQVNDRYYDAFNNAYTVMATDGAGAATTMRIDTGSVRFNTAPANPVSLTACAGAVGTGITVNLTWTNPTRLLLWSQNNALGLQGDTGITLTAAAGGVGVSGGMNFGSTLAASTTDLSRHIALFGTTFGLGVTSARLNHVAPAGSTHAFVIGTTDTMLVANTGIQFAAVPLGFNAATPIARPTVSGAKGSNAALASLLTALASYGLITDTTTA